MNTGTAGTAPSQRPASVELIAAMLWDFRLELAVLADTGGLDPELLAGIVKRASAPGFDRFRSQLRSSGYCARPVRLRGEICDRHGHRVWSTDAEPDGVLRKACGNRREAVCPSCAERYRQDAYHLIGAGLRGGKGVPASVSAHPFVFATLTAPSFGHVHTRPLDRDANARRCRPRRDAPVCPHGVRLSCGEVHAEDDACLGQPLCTQCFDHEAAVIWNNTIGELWRRTTVYLPRHLAAVLGMTQKRLRQLARIAYVKVAEYQARGLCAPARRDPGRPRDAGLPPRGDPSTRPQVHQSAARPRRRWRDRSRLRANRWRPRGGAGRAARTLGPGARGAADRGRG